VWENVLYCGRDGSGKPAGRKAMEASGGGATLGAPANG